MGTAVGLLAILSAALLYSPKTAFPGIAAALPVAGAAMVIAFGSHTRPSVCRSFLTSRPLLLAGEVSYSWYLWHWPLLAIARTVDMGRHDMPRDLALIVIAFCLALLSTRYIEGPIRRRQLPVFVREWPSIASGAMMLSIAAVAAFGLKVSAQRSFERETPSSLPCMKYRGTTRPDSQGACILSNGTAQSAFLIGDSHANHWSPAVSEWARRQNVGAIEFSYGGCPVPIAATLEGSEVLPAGCKQFSAIVTDEISKAASPVGGPIVVLTARWPSYLTEGPTQASTFEAGLDATLSILERMHAKVLVIGPTPKFPMSAPACLARRSPQQCRIARSEYDAMSVDIVAMLERVTSRHKGMVFWSPAGDYCDKDFCYPAREGTLLFRDEHHLSRQGAMSALPALSAQLDSLMN